MTSKTFVLIQNTEHQMPHDMHVYSEYSWRLGIPDGGLCSFLAGASVLLLHVTQRWL
jgi:hypothetical protein